MTLVVLLRSPTSHPDRYETALNDAGFNPTSLSVLETALSVSTLRQIIRQGPQDTGIGGVIVTSQRSAEAWGHAVDDLMRNDKPNPEEWAAGWNEVPFYTVGHATAAYLTSLIGSEASPLRLKLCPGLVRGADSGTSEKLAYQIVADYSTSTKLLYLTGDKNRDTLPSIIAEKGQELVSLRQEQVYETTGIDLDVFEKGLLGYLSKISGDEMCWMVFFAPSSSAHVLPVLERHLSFERINSSPASGLHACRVAAIGPTTAEFLQQEHGLVVHAIPPKPNATALVESIRAVS